MFKIKFGLDIDMLRELFERWKTKMFPHCKESAYITDILTKYEKIHFGINKIIHPKIRLRYFYFLFFLFLEIIRDAKKLIVVLN